MSEPEINYYPEDIQSSSKEGDTFNPAYNTPNVPVSDLNMIPSANGSIMSRDSMQSPNFVPGTHGAGWQIKSNGDASFQNVTVNNVQEGGVISITVIPGDNLQTALDSINTQGGGTLRLSPGTYAINANLNVYDNTRILGDSSNNTILNFSSQSYSILLTGTNVYTTGTISSISSGVNVVGSGTTWTSAMIGLQIFINNRWYVIVNVTDTTHLTLATGYADGATFSGSYRIANPINNVSIQGVTIKNSTTTALSGTDIRDIDLEDVVFLSNNKGFVFTNFMNILPKKVVCSASTSNGYELTNGSFCNSDAVASVSNGGAGAVLNNIKSCPFINSACDSNTGDGINATDISSCLFKVECASNGGQGIEFVSGCNNNFINDSLISNNTSDGIKLTATSDYNTIGGSVNLTNNGGYGINIAASTCDNNIILAPNYVTNSSGTYSDSGTNTTVISPFVSLPTAGFSTFWESNGLFTAIDQGAPSVDSSLGLALNTATGNRSQGYRFPGGTSHYVFGGSKIMEFSFLALPIFNATNAFPNIFCVVGDLGAGASSVETKEHIGFKFTMGNNTMTTYATNANGTTQTTTDLSISTNVTHQFAVIFNGSSAKFYVDGVLKATHTTNLPSSTSLTAVNFFYFVFDADGNSSPGQGMYIKSVEYKLKNN